MKIVLVHPAGSNWLPGKKDVAAVANRMAPLGLLSIAAYLEKDGYDVAVIDCLGPRAKSGTPATVRQILRHDPDLVGFSATTSGFLDGYGLAAGIKALRPQIRTIFGGVHISALGGVLLERFKHIDYLAMGEGEVSMSQLASGRHPRDISGLVWRNDNQVVTNPQREHIRNLDDLPFPAYEKLKGFPKGYR